MFSKHFGVGDPDNLKKLTSYYKCEDVYGEYDINDDKFIPYDYKDKSPFEIDYDLLDFQRTDLQDLCESIIARKSYDVNGYHYPIPQYLKRKMFYCNETRIKSFNEETGEVTIEVRNVASKLQKLVTSALFKHICADTIRKQGQD